MRYSGFVANKAKWLASFIVAVNFNTLYAQEIRDLYYAQPTGSGLYLGLLPLQKGAVLAGIDRVYLLSESNMITDTLDLPLKAKSTINDRILHFGLIDREYLGVSTNNRAMLLRIVNNRFKVENDIHTTGKAFQKEVNQKIGNNVKVYFALADVDGMLICAEGQRGPSHFYLEENGGVSINLTPATDHVSGYRQGEVIGFNEYNFAGDSIYLWDRKTNRLTVLNKRLKSVNHFTPSNLERPESEMNEFYWDPFTKRKYLFTIRENKVNQLFQYNLQENMLVLIDEYESLVRGVFDGRLYVSQYFDGVPGHYLIPITGLNQEPVMLNKIEINENK